MLARAMEVRDERGRQLVSLVRIERRGLGKLDGESRRVARMYVPARIEDDADGTR
jgi:hypothetical protein